ncbi:hypothetical protein [Methylobacterium komagatae]
MGEEADEAWADLGAADGGRQSEEGADEEERHAPAPHPEPPGADQHVEDEEQRPGLGVAPLPEGGFQGEAHGRQADEAEHEAGAHPAFEAIEGVIGKAPGEVGQAGIGEGRDRPRPRRQDAQRGQIRLFDDLRIDLGANPGIGQRDGEHARGGRQAEDLHQQERPEQLVDRAEGGAGDPHRPRPGERDGEEEPRPRSHRNPEHGEGYRVEDARSLDAQDVRPDQSAEETRQFREGMERRDVQIRDEQTGERGEREPAADGAITLWRQGEAHQAAS